MKEDEEKSRVEAIKLAAGSVKYKGLSVPETMIQAVQVLCGYYERMKKKSYLELAAWHVQAYLEMGFAYQDGKKVFDQVMGYLETDGVHYCPKKIYADRKIKLNKTQVRGMIKTWPSSVKQNMKFSEVVDDIIGKVSRKENGTYQYRCNVTGDVYELTVQKDEAFFHDLRRGIFYTFLVPEKKQR